MRDGFSLARCTCGSDFKPAALHAAECQYALDFDAFEAARDEDMKEERRLRREREEAWERGIEVTERKTV